MDVIDGYCRLCREARRVIKSEVTLGAKVEMRDNRILCNYGARTFSLLRSLINDTYF